MGGSSRNATLIRERFDRGLTLEQAADEIGIGADVLYRAERQGAVPRQPAPKRIADFYGLKPSDIWPVDDTNGQEAAA